MCEDKEEEKSYFILPNWKTVKRWIAKKAHNLSVKLGYEVRVLKYDVKVDITTKLPRAGGEYHSGVLLTAEEAVELNQYRRFNFSFMAHCPGDIEKADHSFVQLEAAPEEQKFISTKKEGKDGNGES